MPAGSPARRVSHVAPDDRAQGEVNWLRAEFGAVHLLACMAKLNAEIRRDLTPRGIVGRPLRLP